MIIIPAIFLLGRRARRTWQWNEQARERFSTRRRLGYGTAYAFIHLKREWIWSPFSAPACLTEPIKAQ